MQKNFLVEETGMELLLLIFDTLPKDQEVRFTDLSFFVASQKPGYDFWWNEQIPRSLAYSVGSMELTPQISSHGLFRTAVYKPAAAAKAIKNRSSPIAKERGADDLINWGYIQTLTLNSDSDSGDV